MPVISPELRDPFSPLSEDFLQNPYPYYKRLREEAPVFWSDPGQYWLISSYEHVNHILRDIRFGKSLNNAAIAMQMMERFKHPEFIGMMMQRINWMLVQDPPNHTRLRGLVNKAFTPKTVDSLRDRIQAIANKLLDAVQEKGRMDLIADFAFPLPVTVIAHMLGIPPEDQDKFKAWSRPIADTFDISGVTPELARAAKKANDQLIAYLKPIVKQRRKEPREDLISALVQAEEEGKKLSEDELLSNCVLILLAGHETTVNLIGNGTLALLRNPDQLELLREKPELAESAVNEFLRYDPSVQMTRRFPMEDTEIGGKKIKKGAMVTVLIGAANHDPAVFKDPDKLDITRSDNKHLSFGAGIHHCLGSALAQVEAQIAISTLLNRLPDLRLDTDKLEYKKAPVLRGVSVLPLAF